MLNTLATRADISFNEYMAPELVVSYIYHLFRVVRNKNDVAWIRNLLFQLKEDYKNIDRFITYNVKSNMWPTCIQ